MFPAAHLDDLNRFTRLVWGNPRALLRQLPPHGVEFIDLGAYFNVFQSLFQGILQHDKILVREEYHTALQAFRKRKYKRGVYVTGQPGIGKTYFLVYALIHLLGKKKLVALQGASFYLFFKNDVALYPLTAQVPLCAYSSLVWALSDANAHVQIPHSIFFSKGDRIRVIQTTSPKRSYRNWSKYVDALCYIMDIWTEEEVENLAMLLGLDVDRMITLARKWGPVPRTLLQYIDKEDSRIEAWYRRCSKKAVAECSEFLDGGMTLDFPDPLSPFYFLLPRKTTAGVVCHNLPDMSVPTRTLRCLLAEALQGQHHLTKLKFYGDMKSWVSSEPYQAAEFIYESWFHSFVSAGNEIQCQWVTMQDSDDDMVQLPTTSRGTNVVIPTSQDAPLSHTPPFYWIPPLGYLPGIHSVLVLETEIFMFQVALRHDTTRSPLIKGLQELRKILPENLKDLPWRVVFVGNEVMKEVPQEWALELSFPKQGTRVPVGWFAMDPVQDGVVYRAYRDESDPMSEEYHNEEMRGMERGTFPSHLLDII